MSNVNYMTHDLPSALVTASPYYSSESKPSSGPSHHLFYIQSPHLIFCFSSSNTCVEYPACLVAPPPHTITSFPNKL